MINIKFKFCYMFSLFAIIWITSIDSLYGQRKIKVENSNEYIEISKSLERKFKRDAARLALRLKEENGHELRYEDVSIPVNTIETIYDILTHVYVNSESARKIAKYNIHTFPNPSINHFMVIFDKEIDWAAPLREGISETDSEDINSLLEEYNLKIADHLQWNDSQDAIKIRSKMPLNMAALSNEFYNVEGVVEIDLGIPNIEGNDIQIEQVNGMWEVTYILRFGSYISDNGKKHIWKYRVNKDNSVILFEEDGDPVPDWLNGGYGISDCKSLIIEDRHNDNIHILQTALLTFVDRGKYNHSIEFLNNRNGTLAKVYSKGGFQLHPNDEIFFKKQNDKEIKKFRFTNLGKLTNQNFFVLDLADLKWFSDGTIIYVYFKSNTTEEMYKYSLDSDQQSGLKKMASCFSIKLD